VAILGIAGILAAFESVYLSAQRAEFGSSRIAAWHRAFQVLTLALFGC